MSAGDGIVRAYLPLVRAGISSSWTQPDDGSAIPPGALDLPLRLWVNDEAHTEPDRAVDVPVSIRGPGDVTGLDPAQVVRTSPLHGAGDAEPGYFPLVEFQRPYLPWLFTPRAPAPGNRLRPWIVLVVVDAADSTITPTIGARLPVLDCPLSQLPDLSESWAWAHAQVLRPRALLSVEETLTRAPALTSSRLVCPRRLVAGTTYRACIVPAFDAGRLRGLGTEPDPGAPLTAAWPLPEDGPRARLPVYYQWEFTTGDAGTFETLAAALSPAPPHHARGSRGLDVSEPGWGATAPSRRTVELATALVVPTVTPRPWPQPERSAYAAALQAAVDPAAGDVRPPIYGGRAARVTELGPNSPAWLRELNLDPRYRVAAGVGALAVRLEQEELVSEAWRQLPADLVADATATRRAVAGELRRSVAQRHVAPLSLRTFLQVTDPLGRGGTGPASEARTDPATAGSRAGGRAVGAFTAAHSRMAARPRTAVAVREARLAATPDAAETWAARQRLLTPPPGASTAGSARSGARSGARDMAPGPSIRPRFTPRYVRPLYELLRDYVPELLLSGAADVPQDTVTLLRVDPAFVEAFLVGANHELAGELAWRRYPADPLGTYFTQFWTGSTSGDPSNREMSDVATWAPDSHLGEHQATHDSGLLVLLVRGSLLRRFPRTVIAACAGVWRGASRAPGTESRLPLFRARWGTDMTLLGFALEEGAARGGLDPATDDPGWYFVVQEPPEEPRFGLDDPTSEAVGTRPGAWKDLSWAHLADDQAQLDALTHAPVAGRLLGLELDGVPWGADAAATALITEQLPYRVAVHAGRWLG